MSRALKIRIIGAILALASIPSYAPPMPTECTLLAVSGACVAMPVLPYTGGMRIVL